MLKFLKNLFGNPYDKVAEELSAEIKRLNSEISASAISEPVLSFVNCVKQNHRRFFIDYKDSFEYEEGKQIVVWYPDRSRVFIDRVTGEKWRYRLNNGFKGSVIWGCDFLTDDEKKYILKELGYFYRERLSRLTEIRSIRRQRKGIKERERLKGIYCK